MDTQGAIYPPILAIKNWLTEMSIKDRQKTENL